MESHKQRLTLSLEERDQEVVALKQKLEEAESSEEALASVASEMETAGLEHESRAAESERLRTEALNALWEADTRVAELVEERPGQRPRLNFTHAHAKHHPAFH